DTDKQDSLAGEFHRLGIRDVVPISSEHGRGVDELLDAILAALPKAKLLTAENAENPKELAEKTVHTKSKSPPSRKKSEKDGAPSHFGTTHDTQDTTVFQTTDDQGPTTGLPTEVSVAIIGHPNVGKSTLLNQLTGTERAIVS